MESVDTTSLMTVPHCAMHAGDCCTTPQQSVMYVYVCWLVILCGVAVASAAEHGGGEGCTYVCPSLRTLQRRSSSDGLEDICPRTIWNNKGLPQVKKTRHGFLEAMNIQYVYPVLFSVTVAHKQRALTGIHPYRRAYSCNSA